MMPIANQPAPTSNQVAQFLAPETSSKQIFTTTLFAQPYNLDAHGFYFHDAAEFSTKSKNLRDRFGSPVEEFEIQFIDGDDAELFATCGINQANLEQWFDDIEPLADHEKTALYFLLSDLGYALADAMAKIEDVIIFDGRAEEAAEELFDECYADAIPANLRCYFDMASFARDLEINGDFSEFTFAGQTLTCTNAAGL